MSDTVKLRPRRSSSWMLLPSRLGRPFWAALFPRGRSTLRAHFGMRACTVKPSPRLGEGYAGRSAVGGDQTRMSTRSGGASLWVEADSDEDWTGCVRSGCCGALALNPASVCGAASVAFRPADPDVVSKKAPPGVTCMASSFFVRCHYYGFCNSYSQEKTNTNNV